jgi:protein involved in polysaccharide export with SLBB domain
METLRRCVSGGRYRSVIVRVSSALVATGLIVSFSPVKAGPYTLQPGDTVEVWAAQEPSLNREVVIRPDGRISLPLAGHVQAAGLTPEELEAALIERLSEYFKTGVDLTVMLGPDEAQESPTIYVAGDVATPGAYPYRPGMTVLHAISVAGGLFRVESTAEFDRVVVARGEIELAQQQLKEALVREARLRAELEQRDTLQLPPEIAASAEPPAPDGPVAREQSLLEMRRENFKREVEANRRRENTLASQVVALRAQLASNQRQIDLTRDQLESIQSLVSKGLSPVSRSLEIEIAIADLEGTREELQAALTRAESDAAEATASIPDLETERRAELVAALQEVEREADQLRSTIAVNERILSLHSEAVLKEPPADAEPARSYAIVRTVNGVLEELPASELDQIEGGDLIRVGSQTPAPGADD